MDELADPEVGDSEREVRLNGNWLPQLAVAYDFSIDRMATGRWRWFHGLGINCEVQDLSVDSLVEGVD